MKPIVAGLTALLLLALAISLSVTGAPGDAPAPKEIAIKAEDRNPWTSLKLNNGADSFQFAIVSDNTGGRRVGIFSRAVEKLNLMQPEFVLSVGDLIEGYNEDPGMWALEWSEFESQVDRLEMPFFFCPGNHDVANLPMKQEWKRKFGRTYYEFRYKDVLFVVLDSEDPPPAKEKDVPYRFSPEQREWFRGVLDRNADVRWTFLFLHKPCFSYTNVDQEKFGWKQIEDALQGRNYTVFAGHKHNYAKFNRRGMEYFMLATTGGGSKLRGLADGEFDHFTWVTMKGNKPVIANILLDGVEGPDVRVLPDPESLPKNPAQK